MDIHIPSFDVKKKKVAIFANVYNSSNLYSFLDGLYNTSEPDSVDYFLFLTQSLFSHTDVDNKCSNTIFDLPDFSTFDAAILFTPGLNFADVIEKLIVRLKSSGLPIISIGLEYPGFYSILVDNYVGMKDLCNHLIDVHKLTDITYVAGSKDNSDSNERLQALKDAMFEHNLPFSEDNILYTNWEVGFLIDYIYNVVDNNLPLPQAYVCANDLLAETITYALEDRNHPAYANQVITGFDYMEEGRAFFPSLSSVDQQPYEQGVQASKMLQKLFIGEKPPVRIKIACKFHPGESCGCQNTRNEDVLRQKIARDTPRRFMENTLIDNFFTTITHEMIHSETFSAMKSRLSQLVCSSDGREGKSFYIMVDHYIASSPALTDYSAMKKYTYSDKMDVIAAKYNSKAISVKTIDTKELIPDYKQQGPNEIYMFTPIYYESYVLGYVVFVNKTKWIKTGKLVDLESMLKNAIITHRRNTELNHLNQQLSILMEKDSLTSVKNRIAYDKFVAELESQIELKQCQAFSVICFDINNLKTINDSLGHENGDEYIKNCCKFICDSFKHSRVFRIGGDEFVAILTSEDYTKRQALLENMRSQMQAILKQGDAIPPTARISIATGIADYSPGSSETYSDVFRWADEKMYQHKFIMKHGDIR